MDPHDDGLSIESCEKIHNSYALKPGIDSLRAEVNEGRISEDLVDKTSCKHTEMNAQSVYRAYKYEYFGKKIETYPIFFEWILKRTAVNDSSIDYNYITERDICVLDHHKTDDNHNFDNIKLLPISSNPSSDPKSSVSSSSPSPGPKASPSPSSPSLDTKPPTEDTISKECPTPCVRELICPQNPPCPPESLNANSSGLGGFGGFFGSSRVGESGKHGSKKASHDPDNVTLQCSTKKKTFKLKCSKLPPGCDHPKGTYECEIVDEGKFVDSKDLEDCDLKCREIHAIHSDYNIMITETTENASPIIVKKLDYKKENTPPKKVTTMIFSKNGINFHLECPSTTSDLDYTSDLRSIYEITEWKTSLGKIFSTPLKCNEICNLIDDSLLNNKFFIRKLLENEQHSNTPVDEKYECPFNSVEEKEKNRKFLLCHNIDNINKDTKSSKMKIIIKDKDNNSNKNDSADFTYPGEDEERSTVMERLQCSFEQNHNKTMQILKMATNDLICKLTKKDQCYCRGRPNNRLECLEAAKESCDRIVQTVCQTTKMLSKFTKETIDSYIGSEEKPEPQVPPKCKLRKTSGNPLPEDFITLMKESGKEIINDIANKNMFDDEKLQKNKLETIINSATQVFNNIKIISEEEFDTVKTINSIKETCINLIDKTSTILGSNIIDSPDKNEPNTVQGYVKEVTSGVIIFQDENKTKTDPEENPLAQNLTDSLHSILSSLSNTFEELGLADSSESNLDQKETYSESKDSFTLYGMFASLKDKICSIFNDDQSETTYSVSSHTSSSVGADR